MGLITDFNQRIACATVFGVWNLLGVIDIIAVSEELYLLIKQVIFLYGHV